MTLIQRQAAHVAALEPIYREQIRRGSAGMGCDLAGRRSRANRLHIEAMRAAGYSRSEAAESAEQCNDMARLHALCDAADATPA